MARKQNDAPGGELSCCDRRSLLRGLGAVGAALMLGRCTTAGGAKAPEGVDRGVIAADGGVAAVDQSPPPADTAFSGADGGLPPIDLAAPVVTQTATFALG